jgi:hypothetical protein
MRKLKLALCVALLGMVVASASADPVYTPVPAGGASDHYTIGLYNPDDPGTLNTVYIEGEASDSFVLTFAIHCDTFWYMDRLHFSFMYDNAGIDIVDARPLGGWQANNYDNRDWPASSLPVAVASLQQSMTVSSSFVTYSSASDIMPFLQLTLHINSSNFSELYPFGIYVPEFVSGLTGYGMTLESGAYSINVMPHEWRYFGGVVHEVPEPSSLFLLGAAAAGLVGGYVRRRRS